MNNGFDSLTNCDKIYCLMSTNNHVFIRHCKHGVGLQLSGDVLTGLAMVRFTLRTGVEHGEDRS
jgi:hypothetical protein